jgi:CDP-diacylglycerol pyrophosphatase
MTADYPASRELIAWHRALVECLRLYELVTAAYRRWLKIQIGMMARHIALSTITQMRLAKNSRVRTIAHEVFRAVENRIQPVADAVACQPREFRISD